MQHARGPGRAAGAAVPVAGAGAVICNNERRSARRSRSSPGGGGVGGQQEGMGKFLRLGDCRGIGERRRPAGCIRQPAEHSSFSSCCARMQQWRRSWNDPCQVSCEEGRGDRQSGMEDAGKCLSLAIQWHCGRNCPGIAKPEAPSRGHLLRDAASTACGETPQPRRPDCQAIFRQARQVHFGSSASSSF